MADGIQISATTISGVGSSTDVSITMTPKGSGEVTGAADLDFGGGYRQTIDGWFQDNVAASQSGVALARAGDENYAAMDGKWIALRPGSVTGISVKTNDPRTAGTLTVEATKNGAGLGLTAVLDGTNTTVKSTTQAKDADAFAAGDEIGAIITTDGSWAPTTADVRVSIEIES